MRPVWRRNDRAVSPDAGATSLLPRLLFENARILNTRARLAAIADHRRSGMLATRKREGQPPVDSVAAAPGFV